jgi:hypothetical protein
MTYGCDTPEILALLKKPVDSLTRYFKKHRSEWGRKSLEGRLGPILKVNGLHMEFVSEYGGKDDWCGEASVMTASVWNSLPPYPHGYHGGE